MVRLSLLLLLVLLAGPTDAAEPRWLFAPVDCDRLVSHVADAGVTYRPGSDVDADGNLVTPAELPGGTVIDPPRTVAIDVTRLLGRRPLRQEMWIGRIEVDMDGRARINGVPLDNGEQAALSAYCAAMHRR